MTQEKTRVAVLGLYRSGSSAVAGVLHHLGVEMGGPFWTPINNSDPPYYESNWLSAQLRIWWNEPILEEKTPKKERVRLLAQWIEDRQRTDAMCVGAKHPLLSLCGDDLLEAWGPGARFIWSYRPLEDSIKSLISRRWFPNGEFVQRRLYDAVSQFFNRQKHLRVDFADMTSHPAREVERILQFLPIAVGKNRLEAAVRSIRPGKA